MRSYTDNWYITGFEKLTELWDETINDDDNDPYLGAYQDLTIDTHIKGIIDNYIRGKNQNISSEWL